MFEKKTDDTSTKIMRGSAGNRFLHWFHPATGDLNRWRGQILLKMSGRLGEPPRIPSDSLAEQVAESESAKAWNRLVEELKAVTASYVAACAEITQAEELYTAAISAGVEAMPHEETRMRAVADRDQLAGVRNAILAAMPEAREAAADEVRRLATFDVAALNAARKKWDDAIEELAEVLAPLWSTLADADDLIRRCGGKSVTPSDINRYVGPMPDCTKTAELVTKRPEPASA